jgi:hypothetical protein
MIRESRYAVSSDGGLEDFDNLKTQQINFSQVFASQRVWVTLYRRPPRSEPRTAAKTLVRTRLQLRLETGTSVESPWPVVGAPPEYRRRVRAGESPSQPFAPPIASGVRRTCWHTQCSLSFVFDFADRSLTNRAAAW